MEKKLIEFKNIVKEFDGKLVLKGVSLDIYENEFVTLLGPSGCGKTTLLRILGGFLEPTEGHVLFDGQDISKVPPYKREINTVFQKYALFPHMNVYNNIAFGLKISSSVSPLPVRWSMSRASCCWTNLWAPWTTSCVRRCSMSSSASSRKWALPSSL